MTKTSESLVLVTCKAIAKHLSSTNMHYNWVIVLTWLSSFLGSKALPEVIKLGGLSESGNEVLQSAFRYAIDRINSDNYLLPNSRLSANVQQLEYQDSFQASRKACDLLDQGVAAIFGPQSIEPSATVQSTCDVLNVPHIETLWDFRARPDNHTVNLFPFANSLSKAYRDLVKSKEWKNFAIIYEENEALIRLEELLKDPLMREIKQKVLVKQLVPGQEYRKLLKEIGKAGVKNLIVDVPTENIVSFLKHAKEVDMMSEYYNYFITSLDLHTIDLEEFQYGGTNISGFRLVDDTAPEFEDISQVWHSGSVGFSHRKTKDKTYLKTEVALMYDAVKLFASALHEMDRRGQDVNLPAISCETEQPWSQGSLIVNYMRTITARGLTGEIKFDRYGFRSEFNLKLVDLTHEGLQEAGDWNLNVGIRITGNSTKAFEEVKASLKNKTLMITTIINPPYISLKEDTTLKDNNRYEGYCVDLIEEIAKVLGFKYVFREVADRTYGKKNEWGEWNGMIRELIEGKADLAVVDLTVTYEREDAVDFTMPFMNLGISILFKRPTKKVPKLFSFLSPLSLEVWVYMVTAFLGVSLFLFVVARFSPYEWTNPHPCDPHPDTLENQFTLLNTLWFTGGSLLQQGCEVTPRAMSTRVVSGIWWFFTLIMVSSYTANLAAFLTIQRMTSPIESAEDLAKQTSIQYGCLRSGSTQAFFKHSNFPTFKRMWNYMESARPSVFVDSNMKGVERVKKGNYALLMESTSIEYIIERNCDLMQIGGLLDSKGYGIATPSGSPYRTLLSSAILKLQEGGILQMLKQRWWKNEEKYCVMEETSHSVSASELGLDNVGGVFLVLSTGLCVACLIVILEFTWKLRTIPIEERESLCVELSRELKFAIMCGGDSKPVRKESSPPSNDLSLIQFSSLGNFNSKEAIS
ncbi:glutamate receptor ionotropic, kainate 2-like isoform X2 [Limulus polyphemus]|uniref:Glutamate receptor ionotropic, kainate 2-like isoform X2 n=1 Tax=Limulus polyphemus TaxID=6850 RepID=A0ABM1SXA1_LIMPO|nr:glutamate receptor ionotropic, kainate 2-like isoform X2 [Limulus polyphemus]